MSISLSSSQQYSILSSPPAIQDWAFTPESPLIIYHYPGAALPADVVVDIQVKDHPQLYADAGSTAFDSFIIKSDDVNFNINMVYSVSSNINAAGSDLETSLDYQETISFQDLNSLLPQNNSSNWIILKYDVYGVDSDGVEHPIDNKTRIIEVLVVAGNFVDIVQDGPLLFSHVVGDALPAAQTVSIESATTYTLSINEKFNATSPDLPAPNYTFGGFRVYLVTGRLDLSISPKIDIEDVPDVLITEDLIRVQKIVTEEDYSYHEAIQVNYYSASTSEVIVDPQALYYFVILGLTQQSTQAFQILTVNPYTLTAPDWLTLSETSLNGPADINAVLDDPQNFDVGTYEEPIVLDQNGNTLEIPVTVEVVEHIRLNLSKNGINFTDNNKAFTELFSANDNDDALINLKVNQIGYQLTQPETKEFDYKTGFFNNRSKIHIGEIVRRALKSVDVDDIRSITDDLAILYQDNFSLINYYKPSSVDLDLEIISSDDTTVSTDTFNALRFVAGRPVDFKVNMAFLRYESIVQRVTSSSKVFFNFLALGDQSIYFYKNQQMLDSVSFNSLQYQMNGLLIKFDQFEAGDRLLISTSNDHFNQSINRPLNEEYVVMPESEHQNTLLYEDEYKTLRVFDLTGEWRFSSQYERFTSSTYKNLVETIAQEDNVKDQELSIHTGYVPADNQIIVDEIKRAKKAWLISNETEDIVELVPKNDEHLNYDSDNDLYNYELKFTINKTHDLQNYS